MAIRLVTFGGLELTANTDQADGFQTQGLRVGLLVYLAIERAAARDALQAIFWPETATASAAGRLKQLTYELRRTWGEGTIETHGRMLRAGERLVSDAAEFEVAVAARRPADAIALYRGPFLSGVHLVNTNGFESWVDNRRARHAREFRKACRALLDERLAAGDRAGALAVAHAWADPDPLDDEAQHNLIELLARCAGRADALEQYRLYSRLLEDEGLVPLEHTRELVAAIEAAVEQKQRSPVAIATQDAVRVEVRRIRVVLERVQILDDKDPWILGAGEFVFTAEVIVNDDPVRGGRWVIPPHGVLKVSDKPGKNIVEIEQPVFDGAVEAGDRLRIKLFATEHDLFTRNDECTQYSRTFSAGPATWIGSYGPYDEPNDAENMHDWKVWYRIEQPS